MSARIMCVAVALCGLGGSALVARADAEAGTAHGDVRPQAASLPRLFMVEAASEGCRARRPGSDQFEPMVRRKAYPFGSAVEARPGASAALALSSAVRVAVGESTRLVIHEPAGRVEVASGQVVVTVQAGSDAFPLAVESVAGSVEDIQGQVDVRVKDGNKMRVAVLEGTATVLGNQFRAGMGMNAAVDIEAAPDQSFTRIATRSGMVEVSADKGADEAEAVKLQVGQTLTISRSPVKGEDRNAVSVIVAGPDGIVLQYVYVEGGVAEVTVSKAEAAPRSADGDMMPPAGQDVNADDAPAWGTDQGASSATAVENNNWDSDW